MKLNLGSSNRHIPGYVSVDRTWACFGVSVPVEPAMTADLSGPWPWKDSSIEEILAYDIFEHIGDCDHVSRWICEKCIPMRSDPLPLPVRHWSGRIHVMNEAWRVLIHGGILKMECPNASKGSGQWQDPTHVSPWCPNSLQYYEAGQGARERPGFGNENGIVARFKVLDCKEFDYLYPSQDRERVYKFKATLEAIK